MDYSCVKSDLDRFLSFSLREKGTFKNPFALFNEHARHARVLRTFYFLVDF